MLRPYLQEGKVMEILRKRKEHRASRVFLWGSLMALFTSFVLWFWSAEQPPPCLLELRENPVREETVPTIRDSTSQKWSRGRQRGEKVELVTW